MKSLKFGGGIFKRGNGNHYFKIIIDGKEIRKSLKTKDRKEAEKKALALSNDLLAVRGSVDVVKSVAQAKGIVDDDRIQRIEKVSSQEAKKRILVSQAMGVYEEFTKAKESTLIEYRRTWKRFIEFLREDMYLHEIDDDLALRFFAKLSKKGLSPATYNKAVHFCRALCKKLSKSAGIKENPFATVDLLEKGVQSNKRELTSQELVAVGEELDEGIKEGRYHREIKTLFIIGRFTGLRLKDACLLKWSNIILENNNIPPKCKKIVIVPAKTERKGKQISIPIVDPLFLELMEAKRFSEESQYVCPMSATRYNHERTSMNKTIRKVFQNAGIETMISREGKRAISTVGFHSLRHTFVSMCAKKTDLSITAVQNLVGHGSPAMTHHYTHIALDDTAKSLEAIADESEESELSKDQILALVKAMNVDNWRDIRSEILQKNS